MKSTPCTYRGVRMRSILEGKVARRLDSLRVEWQYEPSVVMLSSGACYKPDFYCPKIDTWIEAKGDKADVSLYKPHVLSWDLRHGDPIYDGGPEPSWWSPGRGMVVIVGPSWADDASPGDLCVLVDGFCWEDPCQLTCQCGAVYWATGSTSWQCRACGVHDGDHHLLSSDHSGGVCLFCSVPHYGYPRRMWFLCSEAAQ